MFTTSDAVLCLADDLALINEIGDFTGFYVREGSPLEILSLERCSCSKELDSVKAILRANETGQSVESALRDDTLQEMKRIFEWVVNHLQFKSSALIRWTNDPKPNDYNRRFLSHGGIALWTFETCRWNTMLTLTVFYVPKE